jgi:hypothetical protein
VWPGGASTPQPAAQRLLPQRSRSAGSELQPPPVCRSASAPAQLLSKQLAALDHLVQRLAAGSSCSELVKAARRHSIAGGNADQEGEAEAATHSEEAGGTEQTATLGADALLVAALRLGASLDDAGWRALLPPAVTPTPLAARLGRCFQELVAEFEAAGGVSGPTLRALAVPSPLPKGTCVAHLVARSEDPPTHFRLQKRLQARAGGAVRVLLAARHMVVPAAAKPDVAAADGLRFVVRNTAAARGALERALEGVQAELLRMGEDADVEVFLSWERRVVAAAA